MALFFAQFDAVFGMQDRKFSYFYRRAAKLLFFEKGGGEIFFFFFINFLLHLQTNNFGMRLFFIQF